MTPADLQALQSILHADAGLLLESGKEYLINGRLQPIARAEGLGTVEALVRRVNGAGASALRRRVVDAMTTNETSFFRDRQPFERFRTDLVPELIPARRALRRLRVWSAACSTGQEALSLAMVIHDHFPELQTWDVRIVGTDVNAQVVERAKAARYSQVEVSRGLPVSSLVRHFKRVGLDWEASAELRALCSFRVASLLEQMGQGPFDIVFLRNVLIYFAPETRALVLRRVRAAMAPDGWLLLSAAEAAAGIPTGFQRVVRGELTYLRPA